MNNRLAVFSLATLILIASAPSRGLADDGDLSLSDADVSQCISMAQGTFASQLGNWMNERVTGIETQLSEDRTELDIRIHYVWGAAKQKRYFCGFEFPGRLGCDPAFAAAGAL